MKFEKQKIIIIAVLIGLLLLSLRIGYLKKNSDMHANMNMQASETEKK